MTFAQWCKVTYNDGWTENHAFLFTLFEEYEKYCEANGYEPIWNG